MVAEFTPIPEKGSFSTQDRPAGWLAPPGWPLADARDTQKVVLARKIGGPGRTAHRVPLKLW
jgi:hypothetical protein